MVKIFYTIIIILYGVCGFILTVIYNDITGKWVENFPVGMAIFYLVF